MHIVTFIEFDGNPPCEIPVRGCLTLDSLRDSYLKTHRNGSLKQSTLDGIETHFKHLVGVLGERCPRQDLSMADLQQHVDRRARMKGQKGRLSPATIRKERGVSDCDERDGRDETEGRQDGTLRERT